MSRRPTTTLTPKNRAAQQRRTERPFPDLWVLKQERHTGRWRRPRGVVASADLLADGSVLRANQWQRTVQPGDRRHEARRSKDCEPDRWHMRRRQPRRPCRWLATRAGRRSTPPRVRRRASDRSRHRAKGRPRMMPTGRPWQARRRAITVQVGRCLCAGDATSGVVVDAVSDHRPSAQTAAARPTLVQSKNASRMGRSARAPMPVGRRRSQAERYRGCQPDQAIHKDKPGRAESLKVVGVRRWRSTCSSIGCRSRTCQSDARWSPSSCCPQRFLRRRAVRPPQSRLPVPPRTNARLR